MAEDIEVLEARKNKDNLEYFSNIVTKNGMLIEWANEDIRNTGIELSAEINSENGFSFNYGLTYSDPQSKSNSQKSGIINDWRRTFGRLQFNGGITYKQDKSRIQNLLAPPPVYSRVGYAYLLHLRVHFTATKKLMKIYFTTI